MDVLEISAKMVRGAVDAISKKLSTLVKNEINTKVSNLYKPGGSATLATLPALTAENAGYVYDMSEAFTTTADFREGAGHDYPAGTNVVVADIGSGAYKYDTLSGVLDGYVVKVPGKSLSTNDYTTAEKNKLSGIEAQANKTIIDATLSNTGQAADAKATGDTISVLRELIRRMEIHCTASGNPATFSDAKAANIKALSVTLTPTQSGSGDPSPDNVRPITGVSSVTVTRSGENGANSQSVTVALTDSSSNPLTVYGGTLNVTTGELTVTHAGVNLGGLSWNVGAATTGYYYSYSLSSVIKPPATNDDIADILCEAYPVVTLHDVFHNRVPLGIAIQESPNTGYVAIRDRNKTNLSAADFAATLSGVTLVYPLKTPVTYQLTPQQLATLAGYNAVYSDAGTVDVTYKADAALSLGGGT